MTDQPTPAAATAYADMRIEIVKRELNQGALAGFDSAVTDYAARLVIAALDSFEASTVQLAYERGVAEGRRQATEDADRLRAAASGVKRLNRPMVEQLRRAAADTSPNWDVTATVYPPSARNLVALIDALTAVAEQAGESRG